MEAEIREAIADLRNDVDYLNARDNGSLVSTLVEKINKLEEEINELKKRPDDIEMKQIKHQIEQANARYIHLRNQIQEHISKSTRKDRL